MKSGISRLLRSRNQNSPVPQSSSERGLSVFGTPAPGQDIETYLSAYLNTGTIWQIGHLLSSSVAQPEWNLYRGQKADGRRRYTTRDEGSDQRTQVVKHPALDLINSPNPFMDRFSLFELSQLYLDLAGIDFWVLEFSPRSSIPIGIWPVRPDRMTPVPDRQKVLAGWVYTSADGQEKVPLTNQEVIFTRYPNPLNPYMAGASPIGAILPDLDAYKYAREYNRNFFINGAQPGGIINTPNSLEDEEFEQLVARWREGHKGVARGHHVGFLEAGATWTPAGTSPKDMDFVNLLGNSRDVSREAFGIHKVMMGVSDDVNRANAQTGEEVFASWQVVPRLNRRRASLNKQLLPLYGSVGTDVEFDYVTPVPPNREQDNQELLAKANAALFLFQAGYDPASIAEAVGLPAMAVATALPAAPDSDSSDAGSPASTSGVPDESSTDNQGAQNMAERLRLIMNDGYLPVPAGVK